MNLAPQSSHTHIYIHVCVYLQTQMHFFLKQYPFYLVVIKQRDDDDIEKQFGRNQAEETSTRYNDPVKNNVMHFLRIEGNKTIVTFINDR